MRHVIRNAFVALSLTACSAAYAATTVPFVFTQGTPAKAAEVNADFQALADAIDALSARVDKLDGTTPVTAADLVGTYTVMRMGITMQVNAPTPNCSSPGDCSKTTSVLGTATVALDGTYVVSTTKKELIQFPSGVTAISKPGGGTGTWSLSNGKVNWQGIDELLSVLPGGRVLVGVGATDPGEKNIVLFIRN